MYWLLFFLYLLGIAVIQTTVNRFVHIDQLFPDILLIISVFIGLEFGKSNGFKCGLVIGLLEDTISYGYLGMETFVNAMTGFSAGFLREHFMYDSTPVRWTLVLLFSLFNGLVFLAVSREVLQIDLSPGFFHRFLIQALLNVILTTPVMSLTTFLHDKVASRFRSGRQIRQTLKIGR